MELKPCPTCKAPSLETSSIEGVNYRYQMDLRALDRAIQEVTDLLRAQAGIPSNPEYDAGLERALQNMKYVRARFSGDEA